MRMPLLGPMRILRAKGCRLLPVILWGWTFIRGGGDAVVSLDVIEHNPVEREDEYFMTNCKNQKRDGVAIIGTPNVTMVPYSSPWNKIAHINNYSQTRLYEAMSKYFENVFIFGMNDEVLHTGMYPMASYIMAMGCGVREREDK